MNYEVDTSIKDFVVKPSLRSEDPLDGRRYDSFEDESVLHKTKLIYSNISKLHGREQYFVRHRFRTVKGKLSTYEQVGKDYGISGSRTADNSMFEKGYWEKWLKEVHKE